MKRSRAVDITYYEWSVSRWRSSRTRAALTPEGRYILREILDQCYVGGGISRDFALLARMIDCTEEQLRRTWPLIEHHFHQDKKDPELLVFDPASVWRRECLRHITAQRVRGKAGGRARVQGRSEREASRVAEEKNRIETANFRDENAFLREQNPKSSSSNRQRSIAGTPNGNEDSGLSSGGLSQYERTNERNTNEQNTNERTYERARERAAEAPAPAAGWPQTAAAIREYFPGADDPLVAEVAAESVRVYVDAVGDRAAPALNDAILAEAVHQAHFEGQQSAGAFKTKVPRCVRTWVEQAIQCGQIR